MGPAVTTTRCMKVRQVFMALSSMTVDLIFFAVTVRAIDLEHVIRREENQPEGIVRLIMSDSDRPGCLEGARVEVPESVIQPGFQLLKVLHHDLLRLWFRVHVLRVNLIPLQHILDQRLATGNLQSPIDHPEVLLDYRFLG